MKITTNKRRILIGSTAIAALAMVLGAPVARAAKPTDTKDIVGIWRNLSQGPLPSGIMQLTVTETKTGVVKVEATQACGDPVCLLGTTGATVYSPDPSSNVAESWTAKYRTSTSTEKLVATRLPTASATPGEFMQVSVFTDYSSGDSRDSFEQTATFQRIVDPPVHP